MSAPAGLRDGSREGGDPFRLPPHYLTAWGRLQIGMKRCLDILAAALGLAMLSPLFLFLACLIVMDSGRPVLYAWKVVGRRGRYFTGYKFRTMVPHAERLQRDLEGHNVMRGPVFKMEHDPRVTRVGRVLRRYSLDELPQLWSVLKGDMSLVGPRPPLRTEWERFEPWQRRKLAVTPGITCLWQVLGRADIRDFEEWVRLDLRYIDSWSLLLDLQILGLTLLAVVRSKGAY